MSKVLGVDIRDNHVRMVLFGAGYRKLELESLAEEPLAAHEDASSAVRACMSKLPAGGVDVLVTSVPGARCFVHRLELPESARKRLSELLPFELEAVLPLDIDELVFDQRILLADENTEKGAFSVLAVASRTEHVQATIDMMRDATGRQPERVGSSAMELAQLVHLVPSLKSPETIVILDLDFEGTDLCFVENGRARSARSLALGVSGFPEQAEQLVARIRQSISSYTAAVGKEVSQVLVVGDGAKMAGLDTFLSDRLGVPTGPLPELVLEGMDTLDQERAPLFSGALAAAMHGVRGKGFDLRQGELEFERGYEHVKQKAPLFGALIGVVILSFLFSVWAESRALAAENEALISSLSEITKSTFGTEASDPDEAEMELEKARKSRPEDPMPYIDGFGLAVALSEVVPEKITHDVEEFDFVKDKLKIRGQVDAADEAQQVAKLLEEHRCLSDVKITKISQVVNSERQRYSLEAVVSCPQDQDGRKKSRKSGGAK